MTPALILAAGEGRRMGGPKALLRFQGESLLRRAAKLALAADCSPVFAVIGDWEADLADLPVQTLANGQAREGMASSLRLGIQALPPDTRSVLILTVDMPAVDAALLRNLLALAEAHPGRPAACAYAGTLGVPAVLPRRCFPELLSLRGDRGAKAILLRERTASLPFEGGIWDLDAPPDLDRIKR